MLKQKISYTDYNGNTREDEYEFNLTRSEVIRMNVGFKGGLIPNLEAMMNREDGVSMENFFRNLILTAVGQKSPDGRKFIKNQEIRDDFEQSPAFDELYIRMLSDAEFAADFMHHVIPQVDAPAQNTNSPVPPEIAAGK